MFFYGVLSAEPDIWSRHPNPVRREVVLFHVVSFYFGAFRGPFAEIDCLTISQERSPPPKAPHSDDGVVAMREESEIFKCIAQFWHACFA